MGTVGNGDDLDLKYSEGAWQTNSRYSIFLGRSSSGPKRQSMEKLNTVLNTFHFYEMLAFSDTKRKHSGCYPLTLTLGTTSEGFDSHSTVYSTADD